MYIIYDANIKDAFVACWVPDRVAPLSCYRWLKIDIALRDP